MTYRSREFASEVVITQIKQNKRLHVGQGRNFTRQTIVAQIKPYEKADIPGRGWNGNGQSVLSQVNVAEVRKCTGQDGGHVTYELVI